MNLLIFDYLRISFGCAGSSLHLCELSPVAVSGGYSLLPGRASHHSDLLQGTGHSRLGFGSCGAQAQQLWFVGSRAQTL